MFFYHFSVWINFLYEWISKNQGKAKNMKSAISAWNKMQCLFMIEYEYIYKFLFAYNILNLNFIFS